MTEFAFDGSNSDVGLLVGVNGLARHAPHWLDRVAVALGEYGVAAAVVVLLAWTWWRVARRQADDPPGAVAGVAWAGVAALVALALSVPIRSLVQRPRPFEVRPDLYVLLRGTSRFSFVNGQATLAMAVGVGLFLVHRRAGLVAVGLAVLQGFLRVYMGVDYPTDVIGGYALGTATTLLLAPLAMLGLVPLARVLDRGRWRALVRSGRTARLRPAGGAGGAARSAAPLPSCGEDLAA